MLKTKIDYIKNFFKYSKILCVPVKLKYLIWGISKSKSADYYCNNKLEEYLISQIKRTVAGYSLSESLIELHAINYCSLYNIKTMASPSKYLYNDFLITECKHKINNIIYFCSLKGVNSR